MSEPVGNFFKNAGSHITVALITALVSVSLALGSYRTKIDMLIVENGHLTESFAKLSSELSNLRVEVAKLTGEMKSTREERR